MDLRELESRHLFWKGPKEYQKTISLFYHDVEASSERCRGFWLPQHTSYL